MFPSVSLVNLNMHLGQTLVDCKDNVLPSEAFKYVQQSSMSIHRNRPLLWTEATKKAGCLVGNYAVASRRTPSMILPKGVSMLNTRKQRRPRWIPPTTGQVHTMAIRRGISFEKKRFYRGSTSLRLWFAYHSSGTLTGFSIRHLVQLHPSWSQTLFTNGR